MDTVDRGPSKHAGADHEALSNHLDTSLPIRPNAVWCWIWMPSLDRVRERTHIFLVEVVAPENKRSVSVVKRPALTPGQQAEETAALEREWNN